MDSHTLQRKSEQYSPVFFEKIKVFIFSNVFAVVVKTKNPSYFENEKDIKKQNKNCPGECRK